MRNLINLYHLRNETPNNSWIVSVSKVQYHFQLKLANECQKVGMSTTPQQPLSCTKLFDFAALSSCGWAKGMGDHFPNQLVSTAHPAYGQSENASDDKLRLSVLSVCSNVLDKQSDTSIARLPFYVRTLAGRVGLDKNN